MSFTTMLLIFLPFALVLAVWSGVNAVREKRALTDRLRSLPDFTPTQSVVGVDGAAALGIDERRERLALVVQGRDGPVGRVLPYGDLVAAEIVEDGTSVTKTDRSSQLGGALVGGLAFGGLGALVGGLSGAQRTTGKVRRIALRLTIDDTARPVREIAFSTVETTRGSASYRSTMAEVQHWHGLLSVVLRRGDGVPTTSTADELAKLATLRDSGTLSPEEFERAKRRLLGG